jgi:U3 small nucleolar RNA-associated protein 23
VLVDGNFLHAVAQMKLGHAKDVVVKFLGCPAKLFTTRCVQHELRGGACTKSKSS